MVVDVVGCAVVVLSLCVLTLALFVAAVQDDGAEGDVVGERQLHIEGLFHFHFVVADVLGVAAVGGHSGVDGSSQT